MSVEEAEAVPEAGGLPASPGLYAWWMQPAAVPGVSGPMHPNENVQLLYVGIAPSRQSSSATLRSRVLGQHLRGNIGASTFRFSLAALLIEHQQWSAYWRTDRALLTPGDNKKLSAWQRNHLRITWVAHPEPWTVEDAYISALQPPLNLAANADHPFHAEVAEARSVLRKAAADAESPSADTFPEMKIIGRRGDPIRNLDDWKRFASTEGKWADDFSAKELARLWLAGEGHAGVCGAISPVLPHPRIECAVAEAQVSFDKYRGGVRNHDVLAFGRADVGELIVGVEGKVNEPLGATINQMYDKAERRKADGQTTYLDKRVDALLDAVAGRRVAEDERLGDLRYQLFTAIAGTAAAATAGTAAAAVVIHLIDTPLAKPKKFQETRQALADFTEVLALHHEGAIIGPLRLKEKICGAPRSLPIWLTIIETQSARRKNGS